MFEEDENDDLELEDGQQDDGEGTPPPAKPPKKQEKPTDWQAKFNGMKGTAMKYQTRYEKAAARISELEQQLEEVGLERDGLATTTEGIRAEVNQHKTRAETLERKFEVTRTIRKEFPALADVYDDDDALTVLLNMQGDALTNHLKKMAEKLTGVATQQQERANEGGTPPPPPPGNRQPAGTTLDEAKARLQKAFLSGGVNSSEYQTAMQEYQAAIISGAKK